MATKRKKSERPSAAPRRYFFVPDCHHPYVDKRAWRLVLRAIEAFDPDVLVTLGDFGDFYATSRHLKDPARTRDLRVEVDACNEALDELDAIGVPEKHFIIGNHEDNLERYLQEKAPELFNLVRVEALFMLRQRGWNVTRYKDHVRFGKLLVTHEVGYAGQDAHIRSARDTGTNTLIGHCHRLQAAYSGNILGKHHVAVAAGWLGDKTKAEYMHRSKTKDWALGFVVGYLEENGTMHLTPVPIIDYRCILEGKVIT